MAVDDGLGGSVSAPADIAAEEVLRADAYALLARLLRAQPDNETLAGLTELQSNDTEMGRALGVLADVAKAAAPESVAEEFHDLFIGIGEAELTPYASYYLTGFLYEKPLANLRVAMAELGIGAVEGVSEPEDHIAALCETMCAMILGAFGKPVALANQRKFFDDHIKPWAERFFADLETAESAHFYKPVGTIGRHFMRIESQSFEMAA